MLRFAGLLLLIACCGSVWSQVEEERCEDFGHCLTECTKHLPPLHTYMDIIDCSDKCVATHCKDLTLNPIVNHPYPPKSTTSSKQHQRSPPPPSPSSSSSSSSSSSRQAPTQQRTSPPPTQQHTTQRPAQQSGGGDGDVSVRFVRPLPGELFVEGSGAIHIKVIVPGGDEESRDGDDDDWETEVLIDGIQATVTHDRSLFFHVDRLTPGVTHEIVANTRQNGGGGGGGSNTASVSIRSVEGDSPLVDQALSLAIVPVVLPKGAGEETIMLRQDVGAGGDQFGVRCSRDGGWVDVAIPQGTPLETVLSGLSKRFARVYGGEGGARAVEAVRSALEELMQESME